MVTIQLLSTCNYTIFCFYPSFSERQFPQYLRADPNSENVCEANHNRHPLYSINFKVSHAGLQKQQDDHSAEPSRPHTHPNPNLRLLSPGQQKRSGLSNRNNIRFHKWNPYEIFPEKLFLFLISSEFSAQSRHNLCKIEVDIPKGCI